VQSGERRGFESRSSVPALEESAGQRLRYEPAQGVPDGGPVGADPARYDNRPIDQRNVNSRLVGRFVSGPQHEISRFRFSKDRHVGTHGQTLKFRPATAVGCNNANGRGRFHPPMVALSPPPVLVRNTQFRSGEGWLDETTRADRTIATLLMSWRFSGLATGLAASVAGRRRYRSQAAAAVQLVAAVLESAWLARRFSQNGYRFDRAAQETGSEHRRPCPAHGAGQPRRSGIAGRGSNLGSVELRIQRRERDAALDLENPTPECWARPAIIGTASGFDSRWADRLANSVWHGGLLMRWHASSSARSHNGATTAGEARSEAIRMKGVGWP